MARRRSRSSQANIWPGFVDGLSTLLLVLMFVLSIFVVAQFYLGEQLTKSQERLNEQDSELSRLRAELAALADDLALAKADAARLTDENSSLRLDLDVLQDTIDAKNAQIASLGTAIAASAEELEAEKALTEDQKSEIATLNAQLAALRRQLQSLQEALEAAEAKDLEQQAQIENLSSRLNAALARKVQELSEVRSRFFEEARSALQDLPGVTVRGDRLIISGDALFGSCEATLSAGAQESLDGVAIAILEIDRRIKQQIAGRENDEATQAIQNWVIRVDGHADQTPLGPSCAARFVDNKGLSTARALSVTRYLESRGVPSRRLVASGLGDDFPLVSGRDAASLAQNRRIEFKLTER
ncbi:OmpA family protein [Parvularcula marina]|uniref:OmpA family protein n=1 Tax=Parvularcula marina TaxID=2292771 RepID=UPI003514EB38